MEKNMIPNAHTNRRPDRNYGSATSALQTASDYHLKPKPSVLLVEDDPVMVKLLTFALQKRDYRVVVATDGRKALEYLENADEPSLILLDLMLPFFNGYEILGEIRKKDLWKEIPVIVMTAEAKRQSINEAFEAGANDYLVKPIRFDDLILRVKSFMEIH